MRFIKRVVFIIILLIIAFFLYRLVNPTGAKALLYDLKTFSNDTLGTHFSLTGESSENTGTILDMTGTVLDMTGTLLEETGILDEGTGEDDLFLQDTASSDPSSGIDLLTTDMSSTSPSPSTTTTTTTTTTSSSISSPQSPKPSSSSSSSSNGLSSKDINDLKHLLENFQ